jgi:hypothetical protein
MSRRASEYILMCLIETSTTEVEDLIVTFIHRPIKSEPIVYDFNPPQLDGHADCLSDHNPEEKQNLDQVITNIKAEKINNEEGIEKPLTVLTKRSSMDEVVHCRKFSNIFHSIQ